MHYHRPVAEPTDRILVTGDGTVRVAGKNLERRLRDRAGSYELVVDSPGMLLLRRAGATAKVLMAGEIVSRMTIMEVINIIATANWRGELTIYAAGGNQTLTFDQGALKAAQSDLVEHRLGEVLFRAGLLDRDRLDELLRAVTPERRFGTLCVEAEVIEQTELFKYLQRQAEQIFYSALLSAEGSYVFALPDETELSVATTVHVPIHGLLMEGVQRIDEMALFRDKVPNDQLVPSHNADAPEKKKLEKIHEIVLRAIDGNQTIEEITRKTGLDAFQMTKTLYHLLQQKQIVLSSGKRLDAGAVRRLVNKFNEVMQDIFIAVATYGGVSQTRETLESWIEGSGYGPFFGHGIDDFGAIDPEPVIVALREVEVEGPIEGLHQALHELAAFALFSATTTLPRHQELELARDVNRRLKAIRIE